ncbi:hypothetical protein G3M48_004624 [Beauveria asiatica]|uniref:N-acetyltransferase domain-containing protein n=1 Tax=Beauveria asiatica TaxID=1069075 RepID=A0AAW0S6R2_9HYPO
MTQENNQPPSSRIQHQPLIPSSPSNEDAGSRRTAYKIIAQCFIINICMEIGTSLIMIPLNPILESIICRNVFAHVSGEADPRCKDALVQGELSFIRGWQSTFDVIPGLLTAMPYTLMANECGRPRVLSLSVLGGSVGSGFVVFICILIHKKGPSTRYDELTRPTGFFDSVFSPRLIWLGSMFALIGGGAPVFNTMCFALLGEATNERQRSTVFFYMNATSIGSQMVASAFRPIANFLFLTTSGSVSAGTNTYVEIVMTHSSSRRRGYARALLQWANKVADELGLPLYLDSGEDLVGLYRSMGYVLQPERLRTSETMVPMIREALKG